MILFSSFFRVVYSYCTSIASPSDAENDATTAAANNLQTRPATKKRASGANSSPSTQAAWIGMELYKKLQDFVGQHLVGILSVSSQKWSTNQPINGSIMDSMVGFIAED